MKLKLKQLIEELTIYSDKKYDMYKNGETDSYERANPEVLGESLGVEYCISKIEKLLD